MRSILAIFIVLFVATISFTSAQTDHASDEPIQLRVRTKIEAPNLHSERSNIRISTLNQDDVIDLEYGPYRMSLLVTDKRLGEFSVQMTIFDHMGAARDSLTLLSSPEEEGSFEFSFDDVAISGTVQIVKIMQSRAKSE
jgi:hypothetical protein